MTERESERLRAQAKEATRQALLEAGLAEMLNRGGLETPSIETICARAGYTRGAFYVHFDGREQFVAELLEWVLSDIVEALFEGATDEATGLRDVLTRFNETLDSHRWPDVDHNIRAAYLGVMRSVQTGSRVRERHADFMKEIIARLAAAIRKDQAKADLRADPDPHELATIIVLMSVGMVMWDDIGIPFDAPALGRTLLNLIELPPLEIAAVPDPVLDTPQPAEPSEDH